MGTDIHVLIEVRLPAGWNRSDQVVQEWRRRVSQGDAEAAEALARAVIPGDWVVGAALDHLVEWSDFPWFNADDRWLDEWWSSRRMSQQGDLCWVYRLHPNLNMPIDDPRDYSLFGALTTSVRGTGLLGVADAPRGLPADATEYARRFLGPEQDVHSLSWASAKEILDYQARWPAREYSHALERLGAAAWSKAYGASHVRWVFGFDS